MRGDIIELELENLNTNYNSYLYIGGCGARILEQRENYIKAQIGHGALLNPNATVKIQNAGRTSTYNQEIEGIEPWEQVLFIDDLAINPYAYVEVNNNPTLLFNSSKALYTLNPLTKSLQYLADYNLAGNFPNLCSKDDKIYFIRYNEDAEARNIVSISSLKLPEKIWDEETSILCDWEPRTLITFLKDDKIYIGDKNFMKSYDLNHKSWEDKTAIPSDEWSAQGIVSSIVDNRCFIRITNGNRTDDSDLSEFWEYHTETDNWTYIPGCPYFRTYGSSFSSNENNIFSFIKGGDYIESSWIFNPSTLKWQRFLHPPQRCTHSISFIYDNYIYVGHDDKYSNELNLKRMHINDLILIEE